MRTIHEIADEVYRDVFGLRADVGRDEIIDFAARVAKAVMDERMPPARWGRMNYGDNCGDMRTIYEIATELVDDGG